MTWDELKKKSVKTLLDRKLSDEYKVRLLKEIKEIEKQGLNQYWVEQYESQKRWDVNPNGLVFPWLLDMTVVDPIIGVSKIMIEDESGKDMNAVVIILDDGSEVCVSEYTLVETSDGFVRACDLGG